MIFIDNKYTSVYNRIIERSRHRVIDGYTEKHHIIPKSLGGTNHCSNLAVLTAREHYLCHLLLTKMTTGRDKAKMIHAAASFCNWSSSKHHRKIKTNARVVQQLKEKRSALLSLEMTKSENKIKSSNGAKQLWSNSQYKDRASAKRKSLWTDPEYVNKMKNRKKTFKKVNILGIEYNSVKEAGLHLGIHPTLVSKRCSSNSEKYTAWRYITRPS